MLKAPVGATARSGLLPRFKIICRPVASLRTTWLLGAQVPEAHVYAVQLNERSLKVFGPV